MSPARARRLVKTCLAAALTLILVNLALSGALAGFLRGFGSTVIGPLEGAVASVLSPIRSMVKSDDAEVQSARAADLAKENAKLREQLSAKALDEQTRAENARIASITSAGKLVDARVVGFSRAQDFTHSITIDAGSSAGVEPQMAVISQGALIGRVTSAGITTATVTLITDAGTSVGARVARTGELGFTDGGGGDALRLSLLDPLAAVKVGDTVVTAGSPQNKPYPPGLVIGKVTDVVTDPNSPVKVAHVASGADMSALDRVSVIVGWEQKGAR